MLGHVRPEQLLAVGVERRGESHEHDGNPRIEVDVAAAALAAGTGGADGATVAPPVQKGEEQRQHHRRIQRPAAKADRLLGGRGSVNDRGRYSRYRVIHVITPIAARKDQ